VGEIETTARPLQVNRFFTLSLAVNLVYAQAAVAHPDGWFGIDKLKHFFMSAFIESVTYSALQAARVRHRPALGGAIGITLAVGVAREIHDKRTPGNIFSVRDLTWDAVGTTAGAVLLSRTIR
jgi:putative lipoprotein